MKFSRLVREVEVEPLPSEAVDVEELLRGYSTWCEEINVGGFNALGEVSVFERGIRCFVDKAVGSAVGYASIKDDTVKALYQSDSYGGRYAILAAIAALSRVTGRKKFYITVPLGEPTIRTHLSLYPWEKGVYVFEFVANAFPMAGWAVHISLVDSLFTSLYVMLPP